MITYGSTTLTSYNTITKIEVYYYKSTSSTDLAGGSWSTTKPTWENGKYIWQKIRTTYEGKLANGQFYSESDPVNITGQQGATGTAAYSYKLNASDTIVGRTKTGQYTVNEITFTATYKQGTGAVTAYAGRFKIETTLNGTDWTTAVSSTANESSKKFTIPENIIAIKCSLYQAGGLTVLLDIMTVPIVKDGVDAIGLRSTIPYYLASDKDTGVTRDEIGWSRYTPQLTADKKYLWVYYASRYSEGDSEPELIDIKDDVVNFENHGEISPSEGCVVDINPMQDCNGYDKPWIAGAEKNIWDGFNGYWSVANGTYTTTSTAINYISSQKIIKPAVVKTYTLSTSTPITTLYLIYWANGSFSSGQNLGKVSMPYTFTVPANIDTFAVDINFGSQTTALSVTDIQLEEGSTATSWVPYENISTITGWTNIDINQHGKNWLQLPEYNEIKTYELQASYHKVPIKVLPDTDYYLHTEYLNDYTSKQKAACYVLMTASPNGNTDWKAIGHSSNGIVDGVMHSTSDGYLFLKVYQSCSQEVYDELKNNCKTMLAIGTTATAYEPYKKQDYIYDVRFDDNLSLIKIDNEPYQIRQNIVPTTFQVDRLEDEIVGGSIVWNQLQGNKINKTSNGVTFTYNEATGELTIDGTAENNAWWLTSSDIRHDFCKDHIYLIDIGNENYSYVASQPYWYFPDVFSSSIIFSSATIKKCAVSTKSYSQFLVPKEKEIHATYVPQFFDLTQMFGTEIANYLYNLEQNEAGAGVAWFRKYFPNEYYEYNAGEIKSVEELQSHDMVGFNIVSESAHVGGYWETDGSYNDRQVDWSMSFGNVKWSVIPGMTYCFYMPNRVANNSTYYASVHVLLFDKNGNALNRVPVGRFSNNTTVLYTMPDDVYYIGVHLYRNTSTNPPFIESEGNNFCINLSRDGKRDGEYEPYINHSYPLDSSLILRGIPKISPEGNLYYDGDRYKSDGIVTRKYGIVDLGTLNWAYQESFVRFTATTSLPQKALSISANLICAIYEGNIKAYADRDRTDKIICTNGNGNGLLVRDSSYTDATSFKTAMSGVYLVYELATPTTEKGAPYQSLQAIDPYGTEEYVTDSIIPVGHETKYYSRAVYGGQLDMTNGILTIDRAILALNTDNLNGSENYPGWNGLTILNNLVGQGLNEVIEGAFSSFTDAPVCVNTKDSGTLFFMKNQLGMTSDELQTALPHTDVQFILPLVNPIIYQLTPQELTMFEGQNYIYSDSGQTNIRYYDNQTSTEPRIDYTFMSAYDTAQMINNAVGTLEAPYTELEWVESTGKQYVYLDWKPPIKTWGFEADFISQNAVGTSVGAWDESTNTSGYGTIFGVRSDSGINNVQLSSYSNGLLRLGNGNNVTTGFKTDHSRQMIKLHNTTLTKTDGTTITVTRLNENTLKPYCNMTVFCLYNGLRQAGYGGVLEPSSTRIYSLKFFDGDTLTVDLVGAIRKSDRITGLYDKVSKHFYPAPGMLYGNEVGDIGEIASIKQSMLKTNPQTIVVNKNRTRMWEATVPFDHLEDGQKLTVTYSYGNVVNSVETEKLAGWTDTSSNQQVYLKLTLSNGNQTDWIPCYYSNTGRLTTHYGSGIPIVFTYRENMLAGASETSSGYAVMRGFYADANYDSNTIYTQFASAVKAGTNGVKRYTLIMRDSDNTYSSFVNQANTLGTTKTAYTGGFVLGKIYYSSAETEYATGANTSSIWSTYQVDLRYDFNITTSGATALTLYKPVYLVGTVHDDDGLFYLDTTQWWTQTEPTSEDGKVYVFIGQAYSAYQSWLAVDNTAYQYYDGKFMPYETVRTLKSITTLQETLENQIDGKVETWCQINDPSTAWTTTELKNQHNGDLWYYTGESTSSYKNNTTYKYTASTNKWTAYSASTDLFDKIDAKTSIYYGKPSAVTQNLEVGDYLVDSTDGCSYRWDGSKWVKLTDYNAAIDAIEVGGKNLLRGTRTQDTSLGNYKQNVTAIDESLFGCTVFTSSVRWADIGFDFKRQILDRDLVKAGDSVTYSIWAKTDDTEPRNIMGVWVSGYYDGTTIAVLSSEWTQYSKTFVVTEEMLEATSAMATHFECNTDCTEGKYIYWAAPKLERGTKATDWTPAPEDTEAEISALQEDLQSQIDEKIQTYYQSTNPASAWTTADIRATHDGDLWCYTGATTSTYTKDNVYRYNASNNTWTTYSASGDLFDKVDGKTTVFYGKTTDTFADVETGDYLVDATDGSSYRYDGSKWVKVTDYQAAIDNIEIGGRNLLKWTAKPKANGTYYKKDPEETDGWYAWNSSVGAITETDNGIKFTHNSSTTMAGIVIPLASLNAVIGETEYVLSFKYRANLISIGAPYLLCQTDGNISYGQAISIIQSETDWKYFNQKIQWSSSSGRNTWAILVPYINISNGWIEIQNGSMKLEKGNRSTDWTPAPEDIDASITTAQSTADEALAATQPISSKTFTDIIGTANDIANASFYFAKVHPTTYTDPWMVKMKIKASVPSDTNFRKTVDITIHGCRSNFISYDSIVANYNSNPIYYLNLYRATQAGIETNKKGHALGFGLRSSTSPIDTNKKRTFEVDLLEVDGCTVDWIDTPVKYADMDGTGSTNYVGCTELGITSNGQNATNNGNTYDRIKYSTIKAAEAIARYNIIVGTSAGYKHLKSGTPWDITYPILYADAALNANATGASNYLTIPFTVTTTQAITLTPYKPVYIEGTLEGTTFTPVDTTPLTQTIPTSDNGHQYILLGSAYSTTAINLEAEHPIYQFQNGNFVTVAEAASRIGANAENLLKATYAVCNTAAGTNAKTADCTNFELYEGVRIQVTFTNANTAEAPTLNIHNTGAKAIYINKTVTSSSNLLLWTAGSKMEFVYDGTGWVAQNVPYALYGTCSTGASTAAKDVTCNEAVICKGTTISVNMTNTNTAADATMNVGSTLAKDIYANGAKLTTNSRFNWRANTTQKFVFDGQVWRMDDDSVKALATAYITEIDDDGIMVHPEDDSTSGWAISDAIQLFKNGISYIKLWIENNIPKIRIGKEDQGHIILDNDSVDIRNDDKVLASFGATSVIGDENDWHQTIAANQITFAKGDDIITYISPDKLYTINAEVADAFYISNYSIRNASDGKLVIGLRR